MPTYTHKPRVMIVALGDEPPEDVPAGEVLVVAPAVNSWFRRWLSDEDAARRHAEDRVTAWVDWLAQGGVRAEGRVGDADPAQAIEDALSGFQADEIVIAGKPEQRGRRLARLMARTRDGLDLPAFHYNDPLPGAP